jgi:putative hydrolase of the HAD superfamily
VIRAIVFDLDDTLYPEIEFVYSGYRAVSEAVRQQLGFAIYSELVARFEAGQHGDLFTPVLQTHLATVEETYVRQLVEIYRQHMPQICPFPEVCEVLGNLKLAYRLAIVSDGHKSVQERKLQALQIGCFFDAVIFSDEWGQGCWKPNSRPFEECALKLALEPTSMVYVGDNPSKDFVGARKIGMRTIRVRRSGTLHYHVRLAPEFEADCEVGSLAEIPTLSS